MYWEQQEMFPPNFYIIHYNLLKENLQHCAVSKVNELTINFLNQIKATHYD